MKQRKTKQRVVFPGRVRGRRLFSLLEICLSLSVLGIIASLLTWQSRDLYLGHQLQEGIKTLLIDLRQMQSLALSHRADFTLTFNWDKKERKWSYTCSTDEPIPYLSKKEKTSLPGVQKISIQGKPSAPLVFSVYSSGRISPTEHISLKGKRHHYVLDLTTPPQVKLQEK